MLIALALFACARPPSPPAPVDHLSQVLVGLEVADKIAPLYASAAAENGNKEACLGWGIVDAIAPVASSAVLQAHRGEFTEIPAVAVDLSSCAGIEAVPVPERVVEYVSTGFDVIETLLPLWKPSGPGDCKAIAVTAAALDFAGGAVDPVVASVTSGSWTIDLQPRAVDLAACED